jgi:hypothetical protein
MNYQYKFDYMTANEFVANLIAKDPIFVISITVISLLGNLITIFKIFKRKIKKPYSFGIFSTWLFQYNLNKAYKNGNREEIVHYTKCINLIKLYSKNTSKQELAIAQMMQLNNFVETFTIFVERVGHEPKLSFNSRDFLMRHIKELSRRIP